MSKRIIQIVVLMSLCVIGITGLQLYWNYKNYQTTQHSFRQDINAALKIAVDKEIGERQQLLVNSFKGWMLDTAIVQITCENKNRHQATVFHMKDTHPLEPGDKGLTMGITSFKEQLDKINPTAKRVFVNHFADNILRGDLQNGTIYYYTPQLGEKLETAFHQAKLDKAALLRFFREALLAKGIEADYTLNPTGIVSGQPYLTQKINTALRRPYEKEWVQAAFQSPVSYFFSQMKWLIITSLLLIIITLFCFGYTINALLSQHKLTTLKNDFINNMTHEINTPIASILITVQSLKTFDHDQAVQHEFLDIIAYQAEKLNTLGTQIFKLNKLAKVKPKRLPVISLNDVLKKAVLDMKVQCDQAAAVIHDQPYTQPLHIHGDFENLVNVFTNVIDNAIKYTTQKPELEIAISVSDAFAIVSFADNGIGVPELYRLKIFDDFFRIPKGNLHDVKGYGLGLSYVKQVMKYHDVQVDVYENKQKGSVFTFKFPLV